MLFFSERRRRRQFQELAAPCLDFVHNVAFRLTGNRYDAEDLTQETFAVAFRKLHQLREPERCRYWLLAILRNLHRREQTSARVELLTGMDDDYWDCLEATAQALTPEDIWAAAGAAREIEKYLRELPEKYRLPLILHYTEEWSYQEIAEGLELPLGTVMSRLSRGRELLKRKLLVRGRQAAAGKSEKAAVITLSRRQS